MGAMDLGGYKGCLPLLFMAPTGNSAQPSVTKRL